MKKALQVGLGLFFFIAMLSSTSKAQAPIPNGDFESWTGNSPNSWTVDNAGPVSPVTMTSDAHSGASALKGDVVAAGPITIGPAGSTGTKSNPKFAYSDHPLAFTGFYKYATTAHDTLRVLALFTKNGQGIGAASFMTAIPAASYTQFTVPILWTSVNAPDSAIVSFSVGGIATQVHSGTTLYLDDLSFSNGSGVSEAHPTIFALSQNYPNPFNPSTTIVYSLGESAQTSLTIYDVMGTTVATLVNERQSAGAHSVTFDASRLTSGVYYYRLTSGVHSEAHTMQLIK